MRLFTEVSFVFFPPEGVKAKPFKTLRKGFHSDVPEWVKKSNTFRLGVSAGQIEVLDSREKQKKAEAKAEDAPSATTDATSATETARGGDEPADEGVSEGAKVTATKPARKAK